MTCGIDFVLRLDAHRHIDVQVKTIRANTKYVFITKQGAWQREQLRANLYLALVLLHDSRLPVVYFIPSTAWLTPNDLFRDREYRKELGQTSKPEWGLNISGRNMALLQLFDFRHFLDSFRSPAVVSPDQP